MAGISLEEIVMACQGASLSNLEDPESSIQVTGVTLDSRAVTQGDLFACVIGVHDDGHQYADEAVRKGACALLVERKLEHAIPQILVPNVREALGPASSVIHGEPSKKLKVIGVTGTAGKSTTVQVLADVLERCGTTADVLGTLTGDYTTPEAPELQRSLAKIRDENKEWACLEVSSHALEFDRVKGVDFEATVFTNLSPEHLDFHEDMEAYFQAKRRLFDFECPVAVVAVSDAWGKRLASELRGIGHEGLVVVDPQLIGNPKLTRSGSSFVWRGQEIETPFLGAFNLMNLLVAAETLRALGWQQEVIVEGLAHVSPVKGRMEPVTVPNSDLVVIVDYSHKPEALKEALRAVRGLCDRRLWVVFGAGGDRDPSKRPLMGAIATQLADEIIVTSDNPRSEVPIEIANEIAEGVGSSGTPYRIVLDRGEAIDTAITEAQPGDLVLIAGKGHETYQIVGEQRLPFDDAAVSRDALMRRRESNIP